MKPLLPESERFMARVRVTEGCWYWTGFVKNSGYGQFNPGRRIAVLAHRYAYEEFVGPIPDGLQIDHLCGNKLCVRPDHLEAVTALVNVQRWWSKVLRCRNGHPYDETNTEVRWSGGRQCRECRHDREVRARSRRAA